VGIPAKRQQVVNPKNTIFSIKRFDGKKYKSPQDYVKIFKSFWNWWIKINRKKKTPVTIFNISEDLDSSKKRRS